MPQTHQVHQYSGRQDQQGQKKDARTHLKKVSEMRGRLQDVRIHDWTEYLSPIVLSINKSMNRISGAKTLALEETAKSVEHTEDELMDDVCFKRKVILPGKTKKYGHQRL